MSDGGEGTMENPWTEPRIDLLKQLWASGQSAQKIADTFEGQFTRNAILGKVNRLGLNHRESPWTEEKIEILKKMWAAGVIGPQIAKVLGSTKSAIYEKAKRLNLPPHRQENTRHVSVPSIRRQKSGRLTNVTRIRAKTNGYDPGQQALPFDLPDESIPLEQRKTIFELDNGTCRWPCGDPGTPEFFYCGNPEADNAAGIPYCRAHTLRACAKTVAPSIAPRRAAA